MAMDLMKRWLLLTSITAVVRSHVKGIDTPGKRQHKVQVGHCSYTFLLPEIDNCHPRPADYQVSNSLQGDAPGQPDLQWSSKRIQEMESIMENNTQWLQKLESYIHESVRGEIRNSEQSVPQNQTTTMLEIGTNLLAQTAEQTRKLTDVETKVTNQTNRLEIQLLENSVSTNKLERELLSQSQEINKLREKNSFLENRVLEMEEKQLREMDVLRTEKHHIEDLFSKQSGVIRELGQQLSEAMHNNSMLQRQQVYLMETVGQLTNMVSKQKILPKEEQKTFQDCADVYKAGQTSHGVYSLSLHNLTDLVEVLCDMETSGGGWTVIHQRKDGSVSFHRTWKEYREGFGSPPGEYWLGNEFVHQLTSQRSYSLRIQLTDWDGNEAYSLYDLFSLGSEEHKYRLNLRGYSGTAGRTSSFSPTGTDFSTKDSDNDRCSCKCSQIATGGWWFDACGPSNLNGIYYPSGSGTAKFNGMKWHYWKGPNHGLKSVTMMIRPTDF